MIAKTRRIVKLHDSKGAVDSIDFTSPEFVYLATANARCPSADVNIKEGEHVNLHQVIGVRHGPFFDQPIHATVSGTFVGLEKHYHRNGKLTDFIKLKNDFKDTVDPSITPRSDEEVANLTREEMTEIIKDNSMVGSGGSSCEN